MPKKKSKKEIKQLIALEWPSALAFGTILPNYMITEDPSFTREKTGVGSIEYFNEPYINYGTEENPNIILNPNGEIPTILYNPNTNTVDDVKLDLLHHYREYDPVYLGLLKDYEQSLLSEKNDILWNSLLGEIFREKYNNDDLEFSKHWDEWDTMVDNTPSNSLFMLQGVDGSLRNLLANDETIENSNYLPREDAEKQLLSTPEARKSFDNIKLYLTTYRLPEVTVTGHKHEDGGALSWEELPMKDRHYYILQGVALGLRDIDSIKESYNLYSLGGNIYATNGALKKGLPAYIYNVLPALLRKKGLNIRVTSGYRSPLLQARFATKNSRHLTHLAVDIVPMGNTTWEDIERVVYNDPEIIKYMLDNNFGLLDETGRTEASRNTMKETKASGSHFHFGADTKVAAAYRERMKNLIPFSSYKNLNNSTANSNYRDVARLFIMLNEGFQAMPYADGKDAKGNQLYSVGYGFNSSGFADKYPLGIHNYYKNGITQEQAEKELDYYLNKAEKHIMSVYGDKWNLFNDNLKAAIMDTYYLRPASIIGKDSRFYNAVMRGDLDYNQFLGVKGYDARNTARLKMFSTPIQLSLQESNGILSDIYRRMENNILLTVTNAPIVLKAILGIPVNPVNNSKLLELEEKKRKKDNFAILMSLTKPATYLSPSVLKEITSPAKTATERLKDTNTSLGALFSKSLLDAIYPNYNNGKALGGYVHTNHFEGGGIMNDDDIPYASEEAQKAYEDSRMPEVPSGFINIHDNVYQNPETGETVVEYPGITVMPKKKQPSYYDDKHPYVSSYNPNGLMEFVDTTIGMPLNVLSPTHAARSIYEIAKNSGIGNLMSNNIQANPDYGAHGLFTDIFGHNNGIVSDEFAAEHPLLSSAINLTGDIVVPVAGIFATHPSTAINAVKGGINDMSNIMKAGYNSVNSALDRGANDIYNRLRAFNRDFIHTKATQDRLVKAMEGMLDVKSYSKALGRKITDLDDARHTLWKKVSKLRKLQGRRPLNTFSTEIRGRKRSVPDFSKMSRDDVDTFLHLRTPNADKMLAGFDSSTGAFTFPKGSIARLNPNAAVKTGNITIIDAATGNPTTFYLDPIKNPSGASFVTYRQMHHKGKALPVFTRETISNKVAQAIHPEAPTEYLEAIGKNIDYVTQQAIPGSKVFGSSANVRAGNLYHDASDIDVITTRARAKKHPEYKNWQGKRSDTNGNTITYKYDHPTAGELDVNVIDETKNGFAVGDLAHELYAQLYPDRYRELMMKAARKAATGKGAPITTNIPLDMSAEELLSKYDPVNKSIVDAFASSKDKHMGRALYLLNYGKTEDVQKGFNSYMNYLLGGKYKPSSVGREAFSDPATNAKLIESWGVKGINPENFINDPDRMKMLFDYKIYEDTFLGRGVTDIRGGENVDIIKSLTYWYPETTGGTTQGVGLNTVLGSDSGYGSVYATLRPKEFETLQQNSIADIEKAIQQVHAETQLTPELVDFVNKLANKLKLSIKTFSPDNTWWRDILRETRGATGKNYKEFINTISQEYNIPIIRGAGEGNRYASIIRDLAEDEITQIFPRGLDRPVGASQRGNSSAVMKYDDSLGKELEDMTSAASHSIHILPSKHAEYSPIRFDRLSKKFTALGEDKQKLIKEATDMQGRHYDKLYRKYQQLLKINNTKRKVREAGVGLSGVAALAGALKASHDSNRRRRLGSLEAEDVLSTLAKISAFEPSTPITHKAKHK